MTPTSPMSSATPRRSRPWWSLQRVPTTCSCSARLARARQCSPRGCRGCCRTWMRSRRLKRARSDPWPVCAVGASLTTRPPFEAPHHTASAAAIIGGGTGVIRPGAAARAAHGVLFLDEAPEFSPSALDTLRQPLESGEITIHRSNAVATFPARFQLLLAANPCPCGAVRGDGCRLQVSADGSPPLPEPALRAAPGPDRHPVAGAAHHRDPAADGLERYHHRGGRRPGRRRSCPLHGAARRYTVAASTPNFPARGCVRPRCGRRPR